MQNKLINTVQRPLKRVNAFALVACIAAVGFASVPAQASPATGDTITARFDGFLLDSNAGVQRIYNTLDNRAKQACANGGRQSLLEKRLSKSCTASLLNDFVQDLDDVRVTDFHQRSTAK